MRKSLVVRIIDYPNSPCRKIIRCKFSKYVQFEEGTISKDWHYENEPLFVE